MPIMFKRKTRTAHLRKNEDISSEDEVNVELSETKKQKVYGIRSDAYLQTNALISNSTKHKEVMTLLCSYLIMNRTIKSDMSDKKFEASGGVTSTLGYEDTEK
jgi:hypothetical protein